MRSTNFSQYTEGRWYIEGLTITNNGGDANIELELNPFGSNRNSYFDNYESYMKAFEDANSSNQSDTGNVTSTKSDNSSFKGGEGKVIDDLVSGIIGSETDNLKKAKLIHNWLKKNGHYKWYKNSRTKTPTQAYNKMKRGGINCADTSRLTASMMRSAGVDCYVVHSTCHYYTVIKYKGKLYCSDATSRYRNFNTYWRANGGCHGSTAKFKGKSSYGKKCGDNPCS
jgi:transglutaminase-like putative cysteine protease